MLRFRAFLNESHPAFRHGLADPLKIAAFDSERSSRRAQDQDAFGLISHPLGQSVIATLNRLL